MPEEVKVTKPPRHVMGRPISISVVYDGEDKDVDSYLLDDKGQVWANWNGRWKYIDTPQENVEGE